jgi:hypothetical protein
MPETTGAVVDVMVGLTQDNGQPLLRVDVMPDGESRGGDAQGRIWEFVDDGATAPNGVIRLARRPDPRYDDVAEAKARREQALSGEATDEYFSLVTTKPMSPGEREHVAMRIMGGSTEGPFVSGYDADEEG